MATEKEESTVKEQLATEVKEEKIEEEKVEKEEVEEAEKKEAIAPEVKEKVKEEEEIEEERVYTIPLGRVWNVPRQERTPKAVRVIRAFTKKHMKTEDIKIDNELNEFIWRRSIEKPPRRVRVRITKNKEGTVKVYLVKGD
jgi:large subunit ribosomal protein L31e